MNVVPRIVKKSDLTKFKTNLLDLKREILELKIEAALRRIQSDEFGICVKCGDDIASARLDIDPTFVKCVNCS